MKKKLDKIIGHSGKVFLAQALIDLAESLNPTRASDQKKVGRMIKDLEGIRQYEYRAANKIVNEIIDK